MKTSVKILVTFALDTEFSPWRKMRKFKRLPSCGCEAYQGEFTGAEIRVALSGVGPLNAQRVARAALEWRPDACIAAGLAGALCGSRKVADVFAAREVRDLQSGRTLVCDERLLAYAAELEIDLCARLVSSAEMIVSQEAKQRLSAMSDAVDMESFVVLWEAEAQQIPAIAIRSISDAADEELPLDFSVMLDRSGKISNGKAAWALVAAPHKIPGVLRLAARSGRAARNLARALDEYVAHLAANASLNAGVEALRA